MFLALLLVAVGSCPLPAQQPPAGTGTAETLFASLEAALESETAEAQAQAAERAGFKHLQKIIAAEVSAHKIQQNSFQSLLLLPQAALADLRQAAAANTQALGAIGNRLAELRQKTAQIETAIAENDQKTALYRRQTDEVRIAPADAARVGEQLKILKRLLQLLADRQKDFKADLEMVGSLIAPLAAAEQTATALAVKLADRINAQHRRQLLERQWVGFGPQGRQQLVAEIAKLKDALARPATAAYWTGIGQELQEAGVLSLPAFLAVLVAALTLCRRLYRSGRGREQDPALDATPWRRLALQMINRSWLLGGAWAVVAGFARIQPQSPLSPWTRTAADILVVLLLCHWALVFIKYGIFQGPRLMDAGRGQRLRRFVMAARLAVLVMVPLDGFFSGAGTLPALARLALEAALAVWCLRFFKPNRLAAHQAPAYHRALTWLGHLIAFGGLLMELTGYGFLARHWYLSWTFCLAVSLWGGIVLMALREWQDQIRGAAQSGTRLSPVRWLSVQACWLVFWVVLVLAQIQAWATGAQLWRDLLLLAQEPVTIGNISISLAGVGFALVVLTLTYAATQLLRQVLKDKLLAGSGLEPGFQESLVTISRYLLWVAGAMVALNVLGVSSTSMAVVFGALGVGLGFGLQNIFNNFVSGIILLFERPIQVGDTVEINGTWARVKKINVRATVVQTYDNASLIIPNSEFISSQVTNWTHKDARLRRTVTIGVAYGSDVETVRRVLLEIAAATPEVLAEPKPQVLFDDFGDSALIFKLRFWTHLDNLPQADTDVRFAINRRFQELGIEIPFPQRDVHLKNV